VDSNEAGSADHRRCGPRLFGLSMGRSNSYARIGGHPDAVNDQTAPSLLFLGAHAGVFAVTRPSPIFRAADQTGPHRVKVNVLDLFFVFLDAAQGAVEEPGLPQFPVRAPALVDRARLRTAPRSSFPRKRESSSEPGVDPRFRGGDDNFG
jgi:hypothetical protein